MKRKWLVIGIILSFVGTGVVPTIAQNTENPLPTSRGNWLYVGGSGPGNYSGIQDALDASSDGDTVFVFDGIYYEDIVIRTSIYLTGENPETTVINGNNIGTTVLTQQSSVHISNFTIEGSGLNAWDQAVYASFTKDFHLAYCFLTGNVCGVRFKYVTDSTIEHCVVKNNSWSSILTFTVHNITISNCTFQNNGSPGGQGGEISISNQERFDWNSNIKIQYCNFSNNYFSSIHLGYHVKDVEISHNTFIHHDYGISIWGTHVIQTFHKIVVKENSFFDNVIGIYIQDCNSGVLIEHNNFSRNTDQGVYLLRVRYIILQENNFIGNNRHASFSNSFFENWSHNYWDDWTGSGPYRISGSILSNYPWFQYDRHPALKPYEIPGMR